MTFRLRSKKWLKLAGVNVPGKYRAKRQEFNGRHYDSKMEADYAGELEFRKKAGDIKDWKPQVTLDLRINGIHICNYRIDFVVEHNDGITEYVEVKGFETRDWLLKWRIFEAIYGHLPNVRLTVVK